jgi:hypothetical protein
MSNKHGAAFCKISTARHLETEAQSQKEIIKRNRNRVCIKLRWAQFCATSGASAITTGGNP